MAQLRVRRIPRHGRGRGGRGAGSAFGRFRQREGGRLSANALCGRASRSGVRPVCMACLAPDPRLVRAAFAVAGSPTSSVLCRSERVGVVLMQ
eukprot:9006925-Alexandrium_andersonii.AAC.1